MAKKNGPLTRAAELRASSFDNENWTFELVLSTGSARAQVDGRGQFDEVLDLSGASFPDQIPLLDSHNRSSLDDQIGIVTDIRLDGGQLVGVGRLSKHSERAKRVAAEMAEGQRWGVSIGYSVEKWAESKTGATRTKTATKLTILEASLVSIPADPSATTRSHMTTVLTRAEQNAEVRAIAKAAGLDSTWVDTQIDADEINLDAVRSAAIDVLRERTSTAATVRSHHNDVTLDNPEVRVRAAGEALYARATPSHQVSEQARQFVGYGTVDLARESLRYATISTTGMSPAAIVQRALHSTSDFPLILGDAVGRTMRAAYEAAPSGLKIVGRQTTAKDFRDKHRLQLSEAPRLEKVNEHGEFKSGTLAEARESYRLATYGKIIGITRQAIINDDLGAFNDLARRMGQASAATEAQLLVDLLIQNSGTGPSLSDGHNLFDATNHKNYTASGAGLALDKLGNARTAMRKQTSLSGEHISIAPKYLVVPADLEITAEQLMASITPTKASDTNTLAGKFEIVVEPRFTSATRWYVAADPASVDGLEYAYLEGEQGVQIETKAGFEVDGVQVKARLDFGAGFVDHRGWYAASS